MSEPFKDHVAIVTGGGRGIGRATAYEFSVQGATVMLAGRTMDTLRSAARSAAKRATKPMP